MFLTLAAAVTPVLSDHFARVLLRADFGVVTAILAEIGYPTGTLRERPKRRKVRSTPPVIESSANFVPIWTNAIKVGHRIKFE